MCVSLALLCLHRHILRSVSRRAVSVVSVQGWNLCVLHKCLYGAVCVLLVDVLTGAHV